MIPTTANFNAANTDSSQPVFVLNFPNLSKAYSTKGGVSGLTPVATTLKVPTGLTQKIEDLNGKTTIGNLQCELVDVNRALLATFANTTWYGQDVTLLMGFVGLTYPTDFVTLFAGVVETVAPNATHTGWIFSIKDKNRILKNRIYATGDNGVSATAKKNPKTLDGNPLALVLDLLENQLSIAAAAIDTTSISNLQNGRFATTRMIFALTKAQDALTFLENELLRPNGLFHFVRYDGRIAIGDMLAPPAPVTTAFALTDSNTKPVPQFDQKTIYNWIEFQLDYDGSKYLDVEEFVDSSSINKFGLSQQLSIASQGLRTNLQGASRAGVTARRIFQRYANGPTGQLKLTATGLQAIVVEVGDYVTVTSSLLEDLDTGTLGWTNRLCQVLSVQPKWESNNIEFGLIDVNALATRPAYEFAPDTIPAYGSATTAEQQQYSFMTTAGKQISGAAGNPIF